jgi:hypothetical protein
MKAFLGTVLSVIAVGVLLIAYGLLAPRAAASPALMTPDAAAYSANAAAPVVFDPQTGSYQLARPVYASERVPLAPAYAVAPAPPSRVSYSDVRGATASPRPNPPTEIVRPRGRDWKKTALVVGGSAASGAGVGAIFGGKKGALIGAALGGGVSTLYEALHR